MNGRMMDIFDYMFYRFMVFYTKSAMLLQIPLQVVQ
ncbi:hypothetical protein SAMN05421740_11532 [Parapedobacter koreensis]|uniref:Uncharacterized protein n=1 Tax=Parapedobacter koreensis TaxID=332977 RepID=A0A1H7UEU9_9SPHI|nr:hypothetical protein SAMN05421740_11532 [Parapedobacter koreensis]